jgi:hypothetical protein
MSWLKNNRAAVTTGAFFFLGFALLLYASFSTFTSYDAYWHLKMGQDFLSKGLSPRVDHYSFTFPGEPVLFLPYLFQVVLALFASTFGLSEGFLLTKIFATSLFLLAAYVFYKEIKAPWPIIFVTLPYILIFLLYRLNHVRPEIFDNVLIVIALVLYLKASESFSHRNLAYIAVLQLFWVNYHVPIVGYVIFFGLFLDKAIAMLTRQNIAVSWQRWTLWGVAIFLIGFVNPDFYHPLLSVFDFSADITFISEFVSTNEAQPNSSLFYLFWTVSIYLIISLVVQRQYGLAVVCSIFAFESWVSIRFVTISGIVVVLLLAFSLSRLEFSELLKQVKPRIKFLIVAFGAVMSMSGIFYSVSLAKVVNQDTNAHDSPQSIVSYLKKNHPKGGNIFNRMRDGGYLLYHLSPDFKVYIDGRTNVLYPIDFVTRYVDIYASQGDESIAKEIDRYNIDFAIYPLNLGKFPVVSNSHPLTVEYVSNEFILLSTRQNNFPLSSRVMYFPMCWQEAHREVIAAEFAKAERMLPGDSALVPLLRSLSELNDSISPSQFFSTINIEDLSSDYHKRMLGYVALELKFDKHAFQYFESINLKETFDVLMMVYAALNYENYDDAEELLLFVSSETWSLMSDKNLSNGEQAVTISLFENMKRQRALNDQSEERLAIMRQSLLQSIPDLTLPLSSVIPRANCAAIFAAVTAEKS